ncbi:unnamed protein product [Rhizophagus irregularis]|nr:unnamed protein product [Rhizophagus irregularis]CAB5396321.1 unnamed protein product [Rhizophagus irregularis]
MIGLSLGSHLRNLHTSKHVSSPGLQQEALGLQVQVGKPHSLSHFASPGLQQEKSQFGFLLARFNRLVLVGFFGQVFVDFNFSSFPSSTPLYNVFPSRFITMINQND